MLLVGPIGQNASFCLSASRLCHKYWGRRSVRSLCCQALDASPTPTKGRRPRTQKKPPVSRTKSPATVVKAREVLEWYFRNETPEDKAAVTGWALRSREGLVPISVILRYSRLRRVFGPTKADVDISIIQEAVRSSDQLMMDDTGSLVGPKPKADSENVSMMLVVAVALLNERGQVLLAKRPQGKGHAGCWEFPGGKINARERPERALSRELEEELGIQVQEADLTPLTFASHRITDGHLLMALYVCTRWEGEVTGKEGQDVEWVHPPELSKRNMPPADLPMIPAVQDFMYRHAQSSVSVAT